MTYEPADSVVEPAGGPAGLSRRLFLAGSATAVAGAAVLGSARPARAAIGDDLFALGVASGDPLPTAVVLWTRLVDDPLDATTMPDRDIPVHWQVARTPAFADGDIVRHGTAFARPELAHSVHVDVHGLEPAREYWYRFRANGRLSPTGRTKTAPAAGAATSSLLLGIANCQDWQNGFYPAYRDIAESQLDAVLHLGDYIYEYDPKTSGPRAHNPSSLTPVSGDQLFTLADYRNRHALYRTDPQLQAAHRSAPFIAVWDDHETENNYADLVDEADDKPYPQRYQPPAQFALERSHAYQAWYEHTPVRVTYDLGSPDLRIYRTFDFGTLLRLVMLDTRQYRTDQPGGLPTDFGPKVLGDTNVTGTLTGAEQEQWLYGQLTGSPAQWNALGQQVMMAATRFLAPPPASVVNLDQWDGYSPQRKRLLSLISTSRVTNPVVLAGDIHSSWFNNLLRDFDDPTSPVVASEFVSTSITSDFPAALVPAVQASLAFNPWVKYFDGTSHGWLRMTIDRQRWLTEERVVASIDSPDAPATTKTRYQVLAGTPGVVPA